MYYKYNFPPFVHKHILFGDLFLVKVEFVLLENFKQKNEKRKCFDLKSTYIIEVAHIRDIVHLGVR